MYLSTTTKQRQYLLNIHPTTTGRYCTCSCPCKRLTLYTHRHTRTSHKIVTNKCQHFLETPCQPLQPRLLEEDTHTHTKPSVHTLTLSDTHIHTHRCMSLLFKLSTDFLVSSCTASLYSRYQVKHLS